MVQVCDALNGVETFADLWEQLGGVPADRIRMHPLPGTATEADVIAIRESRTGQICELIDGVLVEKAMGARESIFAIVIARMLDTFVDEHDLGIVLGADGAMRLWPGRVRVPDVCFIAWNRIPGNEFPVEPIPDLVPNLAIEVLSRGNTKKEMQRKRHDYFQAGVQEVWEIQPKTQTAEVYTSPTKRRRIGKEQALDGGSLMPGFTLPLKQVFARLKRK